jgi:hypothetical protein
MEMLEKPFGKSNMTVLDSLRTCGFYKGVECDRGQLLPWIRRKTLTPSLTCMLSRTLLSF